MPDLPNPTYATGQNIVQVTGPFTVKYNDASPVTLVTVKSPRKVLVKADVNVTTAFAGTSPDLTVGVSGATASIVKAADVTETTAGWYRGTGGRVVDATSADVNIIATISGTSLTAGVADIYLYFVDLA